MSESNLIFFSLGAIATCVTLAGTIVVSDWYFRRDTRDSRLKRSLRAKEREIIRRIIRGNTVE